MTVFEDWLHLSHTNKTKLKNMPDELACWVYGKNQKGAYSKYLINNDEISFIKKLLEIKSLAKLHSKDTLVKDVISLTEHVRDRKYPSAKNLNIIFFRFGIQNIFTKVNAKGHKDYNKILKSFSDKRTEISHRHPSQDITFKDVNSNLLAIVDFTNKIDRVLFSHVIKVSGKKYWKDKALLIS